MNTLKNGNSFSAKAGFYVWNLASVLIVSFVFLGTGLVRAEESIKVLDQKSPTSGDPYSIAAKFVVNDQNKELGRAWIEVEILGDYYDADLNRESYRVQADVQGLSFDSSANSVIYKPKGGNPPVVCGTYSSGNFFLWPTVKPTGHCKLVEKIEKRSIDDGHYIKQKAFVMLEMKVE